ncbi:uncharacterized protein LOC124671575 [Lolium rigidum]|uniref:uncharacterized protein LOC124671575 n=1 Tax=Lolium rigidum TaxID=89674 RepID=UPI001F5C11B4|nr:uncharacterized protein LOC124671575 [Lolium rigidum]
MAPTSVCPIAPRLAAAASVSGRPWSPPASYQAASARCWSARRGRRRRWAGLRARCAGAEPAVEPGSESAPEEPVGDVEQAKPQFDLNLAVVLAGFAFEAYSSPPEDAGWRETDEAGCQTVFLSNVFLREVYDGQLVVRLKKGTSLPAMDPWGTSDPYVVLQLNGQTVKSQVKWATKEPTWNEDFTLNIRKSLENLLQVEAWDANLVTPHKRMGNAGLYLETLCDGNKHDITIELEGPGGGGTIDLEVRYKSYDDIERDKQWWSTPFVSDFLAKSSLGSALRSVLGSETVNASQFVQSAFGQLSSFTDTKAQNPFDTESEVSERPEESLDNSIGPNELQQKKIDSKVSGDNSDSQSEPVSTAAVVKSEGNTPLDTKEPDDFWSAFTNTLNQNVIKNFGISLPEAKQLDGFDLLSSLGSKSREIAEQVYLDSGLATSDTSTSDGSETTPELTVGIDDKDSTMPTKEAAQASFPDINEVSRDVLSQTENILGALVILSKNFSSQEKGSETIDEADVKDGLIGEDQGAADSIDKAGAVASTKEPKDTKKADDTQQLFASAETAVEAWAMLATSMGRSSFIKSDFEKICFLDNGSTDTQVAIWRDSSRRRLVVAFRGTEQTRWKDLVTDLNLVPAGLNPERLGGDFKQEVQVHSGFLSAYDSVRNRIMVLIKYAIGYMDEEDAETIAKWHIYVTGHSLGGALATLLALELSSSQMTKDGVIFVTVYNFGSPRVGNRKFADVYNAKVKDSWRVVNHRDIIPTVPRLMGYCHVEAPIYLKSGNLKHALENKEILDDEDQGDEIGEYTPDVLVSEFMKGETQLVEKLLQTEINLLRSIRDGSAVMQHMEDFYYVTLLETVRSRYQAVDTTNEV